MSGATARVAVDCGCELGEGPQWHAASQRLYWCDILAGRLHWLDPTSGETGYRDVGQMVSLVVPIAGGGMLVVGENRLARFDPATGILEHFCDFEADDPVTRSNDGRVDRHGSLWLSSMGKDAEPGAGRLYRLHRGTLVELRDGLTIPNAICFSPGGEVAWFTDTASGVVMRWALDREGWPVGEPAAWADFSAQPGNPDGAVVDAEGHLWLALWGAGRVVRLDPRGREVEAIALPTSQPSCPAFGGERLDRLYITTAREGMDETRRRGEPDAGHLFVADPGVPGLGEPALRLA